MPNRRNAELAALIETEISLSFTFLETANLAGSEDHRKQATADSLKAYETAQRFMARLPEHEIPTEWLTRLGDLNALLTGGRKE